MVVDSAKRWAPSILIIVLCTFWFGVSLSNPALFGDDYFNLHRVLNLSAGQIASSFLAPNNTVDNRPLPNLLYLFLYKSFGTGPFVYHWLLLCIHIANTLLAYSFFSRITNSRFLALTPALLWALHSQLANNVLAFPMIYDALSCFFALLCLHFYFFSTFHISVRHGYWISVVCFFLATRCKENILLLPVSLLIAELFGLRAASPNPNTRWVRVRRLVHTAPYFLISGTYAVFYFSKTSWGPSSGPQDPYYMAISFPVFLQGLRHYFLSFSLGSPESLVFLVLGALLSYFMLKRLAVPMWCLLNFILILLPVLFFINRRDPIFLYVPALFLVFALLWPLMQARDYFSRRSMCGKAIATLIVLALMGSILYKYDDQLSYLRPGIARASYECNKLAEDIRKKADILAEKKRVYFIGLPEHVPNSDLFLYFMPRLTLGRTDLDSYLVKDVQEIGTREAGRPHDFAVFGFAKTAHSELSCDISSLAYYSEETIAIERAKQGSK